MRKLRKMTSTLLVVLSIALLGGCGKNDDKLHMVTTEHLTEIYDVTEAVTESEIDEEIEQMEKESQEKTTEAPTAEDKAITIAQVKAANTGDALLVEGKSASINRIYYGDDGEAASEFEFLGFDEDGVYTQVYENSDGYVQIYDKYNDYWYVFTGSKEENKTLTLIYPEDDMASFLVESNHTDTIFSCPDDASIRDVYRQDGNAVIEIEDEEMYVAYALDENLRILEATTYYKDDNSKYNYCFTNFEATYEFPDFVKEIRDSAERRTVTVVYADQAGYGGTYDVSASFPVDFRTTSYKVYVDEACTTEWSAENDSANSLGYYEDLTIYLKMQ